MGLTNEQREQLYDGILHGFTPADLDTLLYVRLGRMPHLVSGGATYPQFVTNLLIGAEVDEWEQELAVAASEAKPRSERLRRLADALLVSPFRENSLALERRLNAYDVFVDVVPWRMAMQREESRVCRIDAHLGPQASGGTGVLVGPDLVITCAHVLAPLLLGKATHGNVVVRFDYKKLTDGHTINQGVAYGLADAWHVASSPPSKVDTDPTSKHLPSEDELDFAIVRLDASAGTHAIGTAKTIEGAEPRGWTRLSAAAIAPQQPIVILQHPKGEPLVAAIDRALEFNGNGTRLRHSVVTEPGSSGSPCFDLRWNFVALHHSGDPNFDNKHKPTFNEAIPIAKITEALTHRNVVLPV